MKTKNDSSGTKHLSLRIDEELLYKFRYVSRYYNRSANGQLLFMIREAVRKYESDIDEIPLPPKAE